jgi:type I restriction enzyme M protein
MPTRKKKVSKKKASKKATKKIIKKVAKKASKKISKKKTTKRVAKKQAKSKNNGVTDLINELWQAAVSLRGAIEPADYKRYVLPVIFLRFLSIRYEDRRQELEALIKSPKSEYYTTNKKAAKAILNDPDEYRSAGAFVVPEECRWEFILKNAQADDIKIKLDDALEMLEKTYPKKLRGLLPRIYAGSNLDRESVSGLINLFSKDIFKQDHGGLDMLGRVYEYFIGEFASSEGKRGGEYFTPESIVKCLVQMLEPEEGIVYDPCCGSGGMFVQSDIFTHHNHKLSFVGQESKDFTYRLCKMNMFIHGIDGNIQLGNSYFDDKHHAVKADYIIANPPFNDGSKGEKGWGAVRVQDKDPRIKINKEPMPLTPRNANTMWIMHFLHHLKEGGTAAFVMATGELSSSETARLKVRKELIENNHVDCIIQLSGQLFANTQIPCGLWFLSKNRKGIKGYRKREGEILFIDARKLGTLIPGSRKQKELSIEELEIITSIYRTYKKKALPEEIPGFSKVVMLDEVRKHNYVLTPGRYMGTEGLENQSEPFEVRMPLMIEKLSLQLKHTNLQERKIKKILSEFGYEV